MNLNKRSHDFLVYMHVRQFLHTDKITKEDLIWLVEYLEDRLDYYTSPEGIQEIKEKTQWRNIP